MQCKFLIRREEKLSEQTQNKDYLDLRKLNPTQLQFLRSNYPMIHLYDKPIIGTEEVRQYLYCKRIIYFRHIIKAPMKKSYKMEVGEKKHEKLQNLFCNNNENYIQKYFNVYLSDPKLGLVGLIDYFEFDGKDAYPVEIKSGNIPPKGLEKPHKYQVAAQAMLIESNFDFIVNRVKIFYSKFKKIIEYPINLEKKLELLRILEKINDLISNEKIPNPTSDRGKCVDCECRNYCDNF